MFVITYTGVLRKEPPDVGVNDKKTPTAVFNLNKKSNDSKMKNGVMDFYVNILKLKSRCSVGQWR